MPNGSYHVHIVSGDPGYTDSVFRLTVEGTLVVNGTPTAAAHWVTGDANVTVSDGRLTVKNGAGGQNDKICSSTSRKTDRKTDRNRARLIAR